MELPTTGDRPISGPTNKLLFHSCNWSGNKARLGAAAYLSVWESLSNGFLSSPVFDSCLFSSNVVQSSTRDYVQQLGIGTVNVNGLIIEFVNNATFTANNGTALVGHNAGFSVTSNCAANFTYNTGLQGGATVLAYTLHGYKQMYTVE